MSLAAWFFAIGLDPDVATVFVQSHVPEHTQLAWIMECTISYGELTGWSSSRTSRTSASTSSSPPGCSPTLRSRPPTSCSTTPNEVPVGDDQRQHVEITRDAAIRFNHRFGDTFVVPEAVTPAAGARVMSLQDPTSKMSKSDESGTGCVYLVDEPSAIMKKFKRAVTDSETGPGSVRFDRGRRSRESARCSRSTPPSPVARPQEVAEQYEQYGSLKVDTGEAVVALLEPIQIRYKELMEDRGELARLLRVGAEKARTVAAATLDRATSAIGLLPA